MTAVATRRRRAEKQGRPLAVTELLFLRHAHAGDAESWTRSDAERPLTKKGERQADRVGRFLVAAGVAPDAIVTSPKARAARTAEIVAVHLGVPVTVDPRLGGGLDLAELEAVLEEAGAPTRPILVGHDPDFSELVALLSGAERIPMRKAAIALVDVGRPLRIAGGTLRWLVPPELLPDG